MPHLIDMARRASEIGCPPLPVGTNTAPHGEYLEIDPPIVLPSLRVLEGFVDHSIVTIDLKSVDS